MKSEDLEIQQRLQDRLERLEKGERDELLLEGLTEEERELVQFAAQIISIPKPVRNAKIVQDQVQSVIRAARQNRASASRSSFSSISFKWLIPVGVFFVLFIGITGILAGMNRSIQQRNSSSDEMVSADNKTHQPLNPDVSVSEETPIVETPPAPINTTEVQSALLFSVHGIVQVQTESGDWITIDAAELKVGQSFRTWDLSSAELVFFDGSIVSLSQNTVLTIETLKFTEPGIRQIGLFQASGETRHTVVPSSTLSTYIVRTPNASGEAKGTTFQVSVPSRQRSSFIVVKGKIDVTGQQDTVSVTPGKITVVRGNAKPSAPVIWVSGEGEVSEAGYLWRIDGAEFQTHGETVILGNPKIGDLVEVQGRLLSDGTRLADRIEKQDSLFVNQFRFLGTVDEMGVSRWTISGQEVNVNPQTQIDEGIEMGRRVLVRGFFQPGGKFLTTQIQTLEENTRFEFSGLVEKTVGEVWSVAGVSIAINSETETAGNPRVGDIVRVEGRKLSDGTWEANMIAKISIPTRFEFVGAVETMSPWIISGVSLMVDSQTQLSPNLESGTQVRVEGHILKDGTWLASEIQNVEEGQNVLVFVGIVGKTNPWEIHGIPLNIQADTALTGDITIHSLVRVYAMILEDGLWEVLKIELIDIGLISSCIEFSDSILSLDNGNIVLQGGLTIPGDVVDTIESLEIGNRVVVRLCYGLEDEIIFASIALDLVVDPTPGPSNTPVPTEENITICHIPSGNPNNAQTITVIASAVDSHLGHGDYLGSCQNNPGNNDKDDKDNKDDKGNGNNK